MIEKDKNIKAIDYSTVNEKPLNSIFFMPDANEKGQAQSYNSHEYDEVKKVNYHNCKIDSE